MSTFWDKIKYALKPTDTICFIDLVELENFKWVEFSEGILIRKIPTSISNLITLECTMEEGAIAERHKQDYLESFTLLSGELRDNVSNLILRPNGVSHSWRKGTPHEPQALKKSHFLIFCKYE